MGVIMDGENLLRLIKLQNIFAPQPIQQPNMGPPPSPEMDIQNDATQQFDALMNSYPVEDPISKWRRVGGFFAGMAGDQDFVHAPYDRKVADWKNKIQPAQAAMTQERLGNQGVRTARAAADRQILAERKQDEVERNNAGKLKLQSDRNAVMQYKNQHPNHVFKQNENGFIVALDPAGGRGFIVTDADGEPIKGDKLSDTDRMNLNLTIQKELIGERVAGQKEVEGVRQENRETNIGLQGGETRKTEETRQENRKEIEDVRQGNRVTLKGTPTAAQGAKAELPSQTKVRQYLKAREAYNTHPEWQKWIKFPSANEFRLVAPSKGRFWDSGPSQETYDAIKKFLQGPAIAPSHNPNENAPIINKQTASETKIKVTTPPRPGYPNGQTVMIPFSQWPDAEKQGYKKAY